MGRKIRRKNCQVLDEQVGFEVRWAIAGTSIVTQVIISWPEEEEDDDDVDDDDDDDEEEDDDVAPAS